MWPENKIIYPEYLCCEHFHLRTPKSIKNSRHSSIQGNVYYIIGIWFYTGKTQCHVNSLRVNKFCIYKVHRV